MTSAVCKRAERNTFCFLVQDDIENKMRSLSDVSQRQKTQIDSLKTRLAVVTKEKSDNEVKVVKLSDELDRKVRLGSCCQTSIVLATDAFLS